MPRNKILATKRGKAAIVAAVILAGAGGWISTKDSSPNRPPPAVILASDHLIKTWEGVVLRSHWDPYAKIYDICYGKTRIAGVPVRAGMSFTKAECDAMLKHDVFNEFYTPLTKQIAGFTSYPVGNQASMLSGAYNFGVGAMVNSTAAKLAARGQFRAACEAQTAFNRAGGQIVPGLVKRREMGDRERIGEAELCVSGLK